MCAAAREPVKQALSLFRALPRRNAHVTPYESAACGTPHSLSVNGVMLADETG